MVESATTADGRVARLSAQAIAHVVRLARVSSLAFADEGRIAYRLYLANREPLAPSRRAAWRSSVAAGRFLGITAAAQRLPPRWRMLEGDPERQGWFYFGADTSPATERLKLYVSPVTQALPLAVGVVVDTISRDDGAVAFKVAGTASGLCRPDALVVYVRDEDALMRLAQVLAADLEGCAPRGVPFTGELAGDGLLSWGLDPLAAKEVEASWRLWITNRLAEHLVTARFDETHALNALHDDGVDTERWIATQTWEGRD